MFPTRIELELSGTFRLNPLGSVGLTRVRVV
jgi:hypothetical protein